jgi:mycothiol synthase
MVPSGEEGSGWLAQAVDDQDKAGTDLLRSRGYDVLRVRADHRNNGIARVMLDDTCAEFHRLGRRTCILWTHSGTGALGMYERLGMRVRRSTTVYRRGSPPQYDGLPRRKLIVFLSVP